MEKLKSLTENPIPEQLDALEAWITEVIQDAWRAPSPEEQLERMATVAASLCENLSQVGEYAHECLASEEITEDKKFLCLLINYEWAGEAKAFLLLWRDIFYEVQRSFLLLTDGVIEKESLDRLTEQSKTAILSAASNLQGFRERSSRTEGKRWHPSRRQRMNNWQLQKNPWLVYQEQFSTITGQVAHLLNQYRKTTDAVSVFQNIRQEVEQLAAICKADVLDIHDKIDQTTALLAEEVPSGDESPKRGKIANRLETLTAKVQVEPRLQTFSDTLEGLLHTLPEKMQLALAIQGGRLGLLDLNPRKRCQQWLESEVLPLIYEAWELTENTTNGLKVALSNIRNRLILLSSENNDTVVNWEMVELLHPLEVFRNNLLAAEEQLASLIHTVELRLESDFRFSAVYDTTKAFLPMPSQSALSQFRLKRYKWLDWLQGWVSNQVKAVRRIRKAAEQEENLSSSEKVVRYIQNRTISSSNSHYAAIFQAKGYVGESFWVGRVDEMQHIKSIIDNWEKGYRGAVSITGTRFSGKSFFGDMVANRFFPENTIRISPESVIQAQGRKVEVGYHLEEALEFIRKNTLNERPLVWIDDLELWWSPTVPLNENVRALRRAIDAYSSHIFFLVSLSNALSSHLQHLHNVDSLFQAELNMDYMPANAVREAILIRHGATHMTLLNEQLQEASPLQFNRLAARVHRSAGGNVGEALLRWALSVQEVDEDSAFILSTPEYGLPDFLNPDSAVLLSAIIMKKRANEYQLRKLMGPPFSEKYVNILRRLLSVGLLTRHSSGGLEINEAASNAVGALLERRDYIKYEQWKQ